MAIDGIAIAVKATIDEWRRAGPLSEPLAQIALTLADAMDNIADARSFAPISKELRATLAELAPRVNDEPDDADRFLAELQQDLPDG